MTPESIGPLDPLEGNGGEIPGAGFGAGLGTGGASAPKSGPPAGDAIFESIARRNLELMEEEENIPERKTFLDVGLQFYSDLRGAKDND